MARSLQSPIIPRGLNQCQIRFRKLSGVARGCFSVVPIHPQRADARELDLAITARRSAVSFAARGLYHRNSGTQDGRGARRIFRKEEDGRDTGKKETAE